MSSTIKDDIRITKSDTIEVKKDALEKVLKKIDALEKVVSKQRLKEVTADQDKKFLLQGHLKRLDGKLVVGWYPMTKTGKGKSNVVYNLKGEAVDLKEEDSKADMKIIYRDNMPVGENLIGHYKTLEGEDIVCDAVKFYRSDVIEKFDRLEDLGQYWEVQFHNPKLPQKYRLNINFVNP